MLAMEAGFGLKGGFRFLGILVTLTFLCSK